MFNIFRSQCLNKSLNEFENRDRAFMFHSAQNHYLSVDYRSSAIDKLYMVERLSYIKDKVTIRCPLGLFEGKIWLENNEEVANQEKVAHADKENQPSTSVESVHVCACPSNMC